jgi:hypothetical protein
MQFKMLNSEQTDKFQQWARDNYKPFTTINGTWHPIVQLACVNINMAHATFVEETTHG